MTERKGATEVEAKKHQENIGKFKTLVAKDIDAQVEFFLKSFIFDLGDDWKQIMVLQKAFSKRLKDAGEGKDDLNPVMAADFLQKNGLERTALQRKEEIKDIDLDSNDRIAFIEYLLLHYKVMVLNAFYKRINKTNPHDMSKGGIGVYGVGPQLLDELFTLPLGLDPALEKAIEEFMAKKRARENKIKTLEATAAGGGVKGLTATNELKQLESQDLTDMNRVELTLNAAKKRSSTQSGDVALKEKQKREEEEKKKKSEESKARLKAMQAQWEQNKDKPVDSKSVLADVAKKGAAPRAAIKEKADPALAQAKTMGAIQRGRKLSHIEAPKAGLSDAQKQAFIADRKAKESGATIAEDSAADS